MDDQHLWELFGATWTAGVGAFWFFIKALDRIKDSYVRRDDHERDRSDMIRETDRVRSKVHELATEVAVLMAEGDK